MRGSQRKKLFFLNIIDLFDFLIVKLTELWPHIKPHSFMVFKNEKYKMIRSNIRLNDIYPKVS